MGFTTTARAQAGWKHGLRRCRIRRSILLHSIKPPAGRSLTWQWSCRNRLWPPAQRLRQSISANSSPAIGRAMEPTLLCLRNSDRSFFDQTSTIFPAVALWTGHKSLPAPDTMLSLWASSSLCHGLGSAIGFNDTASVFGPITLSLRVRYGRCSLGLSRRLLSITQGVAARWICRPDAGTVDLTWIQDPPMPLRRFFQAAFFQPLRTREGSTDQLSGPLR